MRGAEALVLENIEGDVTVHELKTKFAAHAGVPVEKVKLLHNKKPVADLKTLADLGVVRDVELGIMLLGGAVAGAASTGGTGSSVASAGPASERQAVGADPMEVDAKEPASATTTGPGPDSERLAEEEGRRASQQDQHQQQQKQQDEAKGMLKTDEFWDDLSGFLAQRLRDQTTAEKLVKVFRQAAQ